MLIDWFTVAAQLVNFLILIWLLRRFLYRPVLKALDERERSIAMAREQAAAAEREAVQHRSDWERKNTEFDHQRAQLLREAEAEAQRTRNMLLEESRKAGDELRARMEESIRREQVELTAETTRQIEEEVFNLAGKVLDELAGDSLENLIVERFCSRLMSADEETIKSMRSPFSKSGLHAFVRSRFALDDRQRNMIGDAVRTMFSTELPLIFETSDEQGSTGIELCLDGHCISWTISTALEQLKGLCSSADGNRPAG
jgi:F-type H+-transporting ATPase subunit b